MKFLWLCIIGAAPSTAKTTGRKIKNRKIQCGKCSRTDGAATDLFTFNDDGGFNANITDRTLGVKIYLNSLDGNDFKCNATNVQCRHGCFIKKNKGNDSYYTCLSRIVPKTLKKKCGDKANAIFEMGCIKSNDKVINPQFSDENSALWKKVNKLPRDGSLIEPCGEEMCYVCTETTEDENCNEKAQILNANFRNWYDDINKPESTKQTPTTTTPATTVAATTAPTTSSSILPTTNNQNKTGSTKTDSEDPSNTTKQFLASCILIGVISLI